MRQGSKLNRLSSWSSRFFNGAHLLVRNGWRMVFAALAIWLCAGALVSVEASVSQLNLVPGEDVLWLVVGGPEPEQQRLVQQFGWLSEPDGKVWAALQLDPQVGYVAKAAVTGDYLHLFYKTGVHGRYSIRGERRERRLADRSVPIALTGRPGHPGQLWALVKASTAEKVDATLREEEQRREARAGRRRRGRHYFSRSRPTTNPAVTSQVAATQVAPSQPVERVAETAFGLVRYDGSRWESVGAGPVGMVRVADAWLSAGGGRLHLLWRESSEDRRWQYAIHEDEAWCDGGVFDVPPMSQVAAWTATSDRVFVTLSSRRGVDKGLVRFETWQWRAADEGGDSLSKQESLKPENC